MNNNTTTLKPSTWLINNMLLAEQEKNRCASVYSDWVDDEYNCGANKFIWGITEQDTIAKSFSDLTVLMIYYNRDSKQYFLLLDVPKIEDMGKLKLLMLMWLSDQGIDLAQVLAQDNLDLLNDGLPFCAPSLELLYRQFAIFANGFTNFYKD